MDTTNSTATLMDNVQYVRRNTLGDLLLRTSERNPEKNALSYKGNRLTYKDLDELVNRTAHGLLERGIEQGDFVTVMSRNSQDFVVLTFALARMGAIMVPVNYMLTNEEIAYILEHARIDAVFASEEFTGIVDQSLIHHSVKKKILMGGSTNGPSEEWIPLEDVQRGQPVTLLTVQIEDDDLAQVLYTSGTESRPKGVMLSHKV